MNSQPVSVFAPWWFSVLYPYVRQGSRAARVPPLYSFYLCSLPTHHNCFRYCHRSVLADMTNLAQSTQPEQSKKSTQSTQSISTKLFLEPLTTSRLNQPREIGLLPSEGKNCCCYQNVRERGTPQEVSLGECVAILRGLRSGISSKYSPSPLSSVFFLLDILFGCKRRPTVIFVA